ncbi:aminotransferase class V [Catenulispora acidiphila DSM 44928]|uniref:Aminotransferase class V n=2 Tax=Catenulispora TaxID=414878 RepID=C7Q691_CATAD|nr:aminotransferase class V [Catenulispora acidiphila DSM 44928]
MTKVLTDTPGAAKRVFLNSAGSSLMPTPVLEEVLGHLRRETEIGGYEAADEREADLEAGYGVFAELLGCRPDQVAFTDSATRSWLAALDAVPLGAGDRVLVGEVEYGGNAIALLMRAQAVGASVEVVPSDADGTFAADALAAMLDERVKLVSVVQVPTNGGVVADVRRISDAVHAATGALVLLDACQAVGQLAVDAEALDADILTGTGRKWLRAPRGTGFLVVRDRAKAILRPALADLQGGTWTGADRYLLRDDARVYELWECDNAGRLGLTAAARYLLDLGLDAVEQEVTRRAEYLRTALAAIPGVTVRDLGARKSGLVTFDVAGLAAGEVQAALARQDIAVSITRRSSTFHDMARRGLTELVRASPHYFVTEPQLDAAAEAVAELARAAGARS